MIFFSVYKCILSNKYLYYLHQIPMYNIFLNLVGYVIIEKILYVFFFKSKQTILFFYKYRTNSIKQMNQKFIYFSNGKLIG